MSRYIPDLVDLIEGGATYEIRGLPGSFTISHTTLKQGYQVGFMTETDRAKGVKSWATTRSQDALSYLIWACAEKFVGKCDFIGFWEDDDGLYHIDPSNHHEDLEAGLNEGKAHGQIAIWDHANGVEIMC